MGRKAKYLDDLIEEEKRINKQKIFVDSYSAIKKINKSNNKEILSLFIQDQKYRDAIPSLYRSNPSYESWQAIYSIWKGDPYDKFFNYLKVILKNCDSFIEYQHSINLIKNIITFESSIINSLETWKPKSRNIEQQNRSLVRHLFTNYQTPSFLEKYFYIDPLTYNRAKDREEAIKLYIHLGAGKSMKGYEHFPKGMVIHKKAIHHLYTTPDDMDFITAIRRIQVLYLGGDKNIFNSLMRANVLSERVPENRIRKNGSNVWEQDTNVDEFWISVMKFFIDHPMIVSDKISEIIDYINNMEFLQQRRYVEGRYETIDPPHPNFTMKGRTPLSLLNQSDDWHYERNRLNRLIQRNNNVSYRSNTNFTWSGVAIKDGDFRRGKKYEYNRGV